MNKQFKPFVIKIQKIFIKIKNEEIIKKQRGILKEEIQCKRIQKFFRSIYYMNSILIKKKQLINIYWII